MATPIETSTKWFVSSDYNILHVIKAMSTDLIKNANIIQSVAANLNEWMNSGQV